MSDMEIFIFLLGISVGLFVRLIIDAVFNFVPRVIKNRSKIGKRK